MKTVLSGAVVVTCDEAHTILDPGDVVIEDDHIAYVGPSYDGEYDSRLSLAGKLLMPGLVNAHTHSGMSVFRSLSDDVDLMVFLQERVWPREVRLTPPDVYAGSALSALEMLKNGVTTYVDMYFFEESLVAAALDIGIRALITPTILATPVWEDILGTWEQQLRRGIDFCRAWDGTEGRIHLGLGPHAPYTVPLEALSTIAAEARALDVPVNIHLVETAQERELFNAQGLGSTVNALNEVGFFDGPVIAAHSVWLDEGDIQIYHSHGVGVAHCPQSNAKLGAGILPVARLLAHEIQVGLGTDGPVTNNNLDLWEEMRLAPLLAKATALDPKPLPAVQALHMATSMGARAVHLPFIGALTPGRRADLIALDLADPVFVPVFSPETYVSHLVYGAGPAQVRDVWVNGDQVVKAGEALRVDEAAVRAAAQRVALDLAGRVAV